MGADVMPTTEQVTLIVPEHSGPVSTPQPGQYFTVSYHRRSFIQKCIKLVTGSDYTHAGIVGEKLPDGDYAIYEAAFDGFRRARLSRYAEIADVCFSSYKLTQVEVRDILTAARSYVGIPYSYGAIMALLLSARGFCPEWVFKKLASPAMLICSEAVAKCYLIAGFSLIPGLDVSRTTPGDLARLMLGSDIRR